LEEMPLVIGVVANQKDGRPDRKANPISPNSFSERLISILRRQRPRRTNANGYK